MASAERPPAVAPGDRRRLAVLASGTGTILEALVAAGVPIEVVGVDRSCRAVEVAEAARIPVALVERRDFSSAFDREAYTAALIEALAEHSETAGDRHDEGHAGAIDGAQGSAR